LFRNLTAVIIATDLHNLVYVIL